MTVQYANLSLPLSANPMGLATLFNTWAAIIGPMSLTKVTPVGSVDRPGAFTGLQILYNNEGDTTYQAMTFASTAMQTVDDQVTDALTTCTTVCPVFCADISSTRQRDLLRDAVLVILADVFDTQCDSTHRAFLAAPLVDILPLAAGLVEIHTVNGPSGLTMTAVNGSSVQWPGGAFGYVSKSQGSCEWVGVPTCCVPVVP